MSVTGELSVNDYVGVDPVRIRKLADRLKDLEAALSRHGGVIRKNFKEWDGSLDLSLIAQQTHAVGNDGRDMSKRADLARNLEEHGGSGMCTPDGNILDIPWDMKGVRQQSAKEAKEEADTLKKALDDPKAGGSRADIKAVAQSLADHQDDPAYLTAFAAAGGVADAARVGSAFHQEDGTHGGQVLNDDSTKVIGQYATGINRIFTLQKKGKIPPNPDYVKSLTDPPGGDMWSVGTLFKYGPPGDKWDPTVLSQVGGAMLDWRKDHPMRPAYSKGGIRGEIYTGDAYVDPDSPWYSKLGLDHSYVDENLDEATRRVKAIDANDPSLALMQRVSENPEASRDLLNGPAGATHAKELVDDHWATPGTHLDDTKWPSAVIRAATSDRLHHPDASAKAAKNIINAGAEKYKLDDKKSDYEKEQYPVNMGISKALSNVFQSYVPDFAESTGIDQNQASESGGTIISDKGTTKAFLSEIMKNKDEAGNVLQSINAQISLTSQRGLTGDQGAYLNNLAELRGEVSAAGHDVKMNDAALRDAEHAKQLMWFNIIASGAAAVPLPANPAKFALGSTWVQASIWAGMPYAGSKFPSGEADQVQNDYKSIKFSDSTSMQIPIMQGLIRSGKMKAPDGHPEWADGNIVIHNENDREDFNAMWSAEKKRHNHELDNFDDTMRNSFKRGADD